MNDKLTKFTDDLADKIHRKGSIASDKDMGQYMLCDDQRLIALIPIAELEYVRRYANPDSTAACYAVLDRMGIDLVCHLVAEGALLPQISKTLQVPYLILYGWIDSNQMRITKFEAAKKAAADVYAYMALRVLQECLPTPSEVAIAKQISSMYSWMAKTYKPEVYTTDTQRAAAGDGDTFSIIMNMDGSAQKQAG